MCSIFSAQTQCPIMFVQMISLVIPLASLILTGNTSNYQDIKLHEKCCKKLDGGLSLYSGCAQFVDRSIER